MAGRKGYLSTQRSRHDTFYTVLDTCHSTMPLTASDGAQPAMARTGVNPDVHHLMKANQL